MEDERGDGFTLSDIFRVIGKRIVWILAISVVFALIVGLVVQFAINPGKRQYEMTFMIEYPGDEDLKYPDGVTDFRYESMIYAENLDAVKKSKADYSNIDTAAMTAKRAISIEQASRGEGEYERDLGIYTVKVKGSYFKDSEQAASFLRDVFQNSLGKVTAMVSDIDFGSTLATFNSLNDYNARIAVLKNQQNYLLGMYDRYSDFGRFVYSDGAGTAKSLSLYRAECSVALDGGNAESLRLSTLERELSNNRYRLSETTAEKIASENAVNAQIEAMRIEREKNTLQISMLEAEIKNIIDISKDTLDFGSEAFQPFNSQITSLTMRNAEIETETKLLCESIGWGYENGVVTKSDVVFKDDAEFKANLNKLYKVMEEQTNTCKKVIVALFAEESKIIAEQDAVSVSGGSSMIMLAAVGFVGAFCVATLIFFCIDRHKQKVAREKEEEKTKEQKGKQQLVPVHAEAAISSSNSKDEENK
ncbi:MAG: hypothetical protein K2J30_01065 [Clostridia bacterium]|nr:hypothetical protein [Clostridia bacterium]